MTRIALIALTTLGLATAADATTINVAFSEDFAEKLEDDYGVREGAKLTEEIIEDLERELNGMDDTVERIDVMILDAKPNRPTFEQISGSPGLDPFRSVSIGGMSLAGTVTHADGDVSEVEYKWFENDIRNSVGTSVWWDANRVSRRFAKRVAESVSGE
ncbi:MAG: hypothetical protein AAFQ22_07905 [Pseudomonadota bacterium]